MVAMLSYLSPGMKTTMFSGMQVTSTGRLSPSMKISMFSGIQVTPTGRLDLHGSWFDSWRRLAETAKQGATSLRLAGSVNWRAGQLITIITTIWKDELTNQNEVRMVKGVSADGLRVDLDKPLEYQHWGYVPEN